MFKGRRCLIEFEVSLNSHRPRLGLRHLRRHPSYLICTVQVCTVSLSALQTPSNLYLLDTDHLFAYATSDPSVRFLLYSIVPLSVLFTLLMLLLVSLPAPSPNIPTVLPDWHSYLYSCSEAPASANLSPQWLVLHRTFSSPMTIVAFIIGLAVSHS